jgi:hypothetical protein
VCVVLFFENEEEANAGLLDTHLLERLKRCPALTREMLLALAAHNRGGPHPVEVRNPKRGPLFDRLVREGLVKIAVVISGQGPRAFGMPEMFTPMQHINANRALRRLAVLISDGRFSGVTYGAAIGHVTPEAFNGGGIGFLTTGDLLHLRLSKRRVDLLDAQAFMAGRLIRWQGNLAEARRSLGAVRRRRMIARQARIAVTNRLHDVTDAGRGVVPQLVAEEATRPYSYRSETE